MPPPTAPVPQKKVKGKKALPSAPPPPRATEEGEGKEGLAKCPPPPVPQKKVKGKKALPSAPPPPVPQKKVKGKKALPSAPRVDPPTSKRRTRRTVPSETTPLGVEDWLTDKDILCWLNQEPYHMEIDDSVRGLWWFYLSRNCPSACGWLKPAQH